MNSVHGNRTHGNDILKFFITKDFKNEFTEIDTYTGGGHVPAGTIWSIIVSVSTVKYHRQGETMFKTDDNGVFT